MDTLVAGKLTVCTYGGFAPVCYKDAAGNFVGYDVSFLTKFAEHMDLQIVLIEKPFDLIWTLPGKDQCDVAGAGIMQRDDRDVGPGGNWTEPYFQVQRSLLVRTGDKQAFDNYATLSGKKIIVTKGSTADIDAQKRYPNCKILYVDQVVPKNLKDAQRYIVTELIAKGVADAFGEGDVSNQYLKDTYGNGGLALADVHPIDGPTETFNFIARTASTGIHLQLNVFIIANKWSYVPSS